MREIKFRAWDKDEQIMFYPDGIYGLNSIHFFTDSGVSINGIRKSLEQVGIMEFTGLLDKNGKEIYEGDILAVDFEAHDKKRTKVEFVDGCFVQQDDNIPVYVLIDFDGKNVCEVIGNIYENPELLAITKPSGRKE